MPRDTMRPTGNRGRSWVCRAAAAKSRGTSKYLKTSSSFKGNQASGLPGKAEKYSVGHPKPTANHSRSAKKLLPIGPLSSNLPPAKH
jgi:hypothetical protein